YALVPAAKGGPARLLVARQPEGNVSRRHARLEMCPTGVRVTNLTRVPLDLEFGPPIPPDQCADLTPPFTLLCGQRSFRVEAGESVDVYGLRSLDGSTVAPGSARPVTAAPPLATLGGPANNALLG